MTYQKRKFLLMRKTLLITLGYVAFALIALLCLEGAFSIARWKHADRSMVYDGYQLFGQRFSTPPLSVLPLAGRDEIESLIPAMIAAGLGMGNIPYKELVTDRAETVAWYRSADLVAPPIRRPRAA